MLRPIAEVHLTLREIEVLVHIANDLTTKEIAALLNIVTKTVEFHKEALRKKVGARGTAGLVRYAIRAGLIEP